MSIVGKASVIVLAPVLALGAASFAAAASHDVTVVDAPGADRTEAYGINLSGHIVGHFFDATGLHGFLKEEDAFTTIDVPPGGNTHAFGINSLGQIVGSDGANGYLKDGASITPISAPGASFTVAWGINDLGQVVGTFNDATGTHGFVKDGTTFSPIDGPDAFFTEATGINNAGQVVGNFFGPTGFHGFLKDGDTLTVIEVPGAQVTEVHGINSSGQIAGTFVDASGVAHGFVKEGATITSIDAPDAIPPNYTQAKGIDEFGRVVGWFEDASGVHGFLATPSASPLEAFNPRLVLSTANPGHSIFLLTGNLTLAASTNGIDPVDETVAVALADADGGFFSQSLPPGSFKRTKTRGFLYVAPAGSAGVVEMLIQPTKTRRGYVFEAVGKRMDLRAADHPPMTISLAIGDESGSRTVGCRRRGQVLTCP